MKNNLNFRYKLSSDSLYLSSKNIFYFESFDEFYLFLKKKKLFYDDLNDIIYYIILHKKFSINDKKKLLRYIIGNFDLTSNSKLEIFYFLFDDREHLCKSFIEEFINHHDLYSSYIRYISFNNEFSLDILVSNLFSLLNNFDINSTLRILSKFFLLPNCNIKKIIYRHKKEIEDYFIANINYSYFYIINIWDKVPSSFKNKIRDNFDSFPYYVKLAFSKFDKKNNSLDMIKYFLSTSKDTKDLYMNDRIKLLLDNINDISKEAFVSCVKCILDDCNKILLDNFYNLTYTIYELIEYYISIKKGCKQYISSNLLVYIIENHFDKPIYLKLIDLLLVGSDKNYRTKLLGYFTQFDYKYIINEMINLNASDYLFDLYIENLIDLIPELCGYLVSHRIDRINYKFVLDYIKDTKDINLLILYSNNIESLSIDFIMDFFSNSVYEISFFDILNFIIYSNDISISGLDEILHRNLFSSIYSIYKEDIYDFLLDYIIYYNCNKGNYSLNLSKAIYIFEYLFGIRLCLDVNYYKNLIREIIFNDNIPLECFNIYLDDIAIKFIESKFDIFDKFISSLKENNINFESINKIDYLYSLLRYSDKKEEKKLHYRHKGRYEVINNNGIEYDRFNIKKLKRKFTF